MNFLTVKGMDDRAKYIKWTDDKLAVIVPALHLYHENERLNEAKSALQKHNFGADAALLTVDRLTAAFSKLSHETQDLIKRARARARQKEADDAKKAKKRADRRAGELCLLWGAKFRDGS